MIYNLLDKKDLKLKLAKFLILKRNNNKKIVAHVSDETLNELEEIIKETKEPK